MAMRKGILAVQRGSCERVYRDYRPDSDAGQSEQTGLEERPGVIFNCRNIKNSLKRLLRLDIAVQDLRVLGKKEFRRY